MGNIEIKRKRVIFMAFFNEFPHTRTYDSDLAWLIRRMKEILARMDSLEERMKALEELVRNFIANLNIDQLIKDYLLEMVNNGDLDGVLMSVFDRVNSLPSLLLPCVKDFNFGDFRVGGSGQLNANVWQVFRIDNMIGLRLNADRFVKITDTNYPYYIFKIDMSQIKTVLGLKPINRGEISALIYGRNFGDASSQSSTKVIDSIIACAEWDVNEQYLYVQVPMNRGMSNVTTYFDERPTLYIPCVNVV